jgi:hypothetical protein
MTLVLALLACADEAPVVVQEAAPVAGAKPASLVPGDVYGAGVTLTSSTPISTLLTDPVACDGKEVRVEGTVTEVCEMRGCWMNIAGDQPSTTMRFKVTDGEITLPVAAKGRYAVAQGTCRKVDLSPEEAQAMRAHEAEEQGRPVDTTTPLPTYVVKLEGTGAVIRDAM